MRHVRPPDARETRAALVPFQTLGDFRRTGETDQGQSSGEEGELWQRTKSPLAAWRGPLSRKRQLGIMCCDHFGMVMSGNAVSLPTSAFSSPTFFMFGFIISCQT